MIACSSGEKVSVGTLESSLPDPLIYEGDRFRIIAQPSVMLTMDLDDGVIIIHFYSVEGSTKSFVLPEEHDSGVSLCVTIQITTYAVIEYLSLSGDLT